MSLEILGAELEAAGRAAESARINWKARLSEVNADDPISFERARDSIRTLEICRFIASTMLEYYLSVRDNREFRQPRRYELANPTNEELLKRRDLYETGIRMLLVTEQMPDTQEAETHIL